jgi:hypothetical protein
MQANDTEGEALRSSPGLPIDGPARGANGAPQYGSGRGVHLAPRIGSGRPSRSGCLIGAWGCRLYGQLDCELVGRSSGTRSPAARPSDSPGARGASRGIASEAFALPWCTWGESSDCGRGSPELEPAKIPLAGPIRGPLSAVSSRSASASSPPSLLAFYSRLPRLFLLPQSLESLANGPKDPCYDRPPGGRRRRHGRLRRTRGSRKPDRRLGAGAPARSGTHLRPTSGCHHDPSRSHAGARPTTHDHGRSNRPCRAPVQHGQRNEHPVGTPRTRHGPRTPGRASADPPRYGTAFPTPRPRVQSIRRRWPAVDPVHLQEILENRFRVENLLKLNASFVYTPDRRLENISLGSFEIPTTSRNVRIQEYHEINSLLKPLAVYADILHEFAPAEIRADLSSALLKYIHHLLDTNERCTWHSVRLYHFSFHRKRVLMGVYDYEGWTRFSDPELTHLLHPRGFQSGPTGKRPSEDYPSTGPPAKRTAGAAAPGSSSARSAPTISDACRRHNRGVCVAGPQCKWRHVCWTCGDGSHVASACPRATGQQ